MGLLDGKVALITGAGGGLGEAYAKLFAREGAAVVVNDLGGPRDGSGADISMAQQVVDAIKAEGGRAVANGADISIWRAASRYSTTPSSISAAPIFSSTMPASCSTRPLPRPPRPPGTRF